MKLRLFKNIAPEFSVFMYHTVLVPYLSIYLPVLYSGIKYIRANSNNVKIIRSKSDKKK